MHALLRYHEHPGEAGRWTVRDLGSANGTFVGIAARPDWDLEPIVPWVDVVVSEGDTVRFGDHDSEEWTVLSAGPPLPAAVLGERVILGERDALRLAVGPEECSIRRVDESWEFESGGRAYTGDLVTLQGEEWVLLLPGAELTTEGDRSTPAAPFELDIVRSSRDEVVSIVFHVGGAARGLPIDAPYRRLLLLLARHVQADRAAGVPLDDRGWVTAARLARLTRSSSGQVSRLLYHAREALSALGGEPARDLIESRGRGARFRVRLKGCDVRIRGR